MKKMQGFCEVGGRSNSCGIVATKGCAVRCGAVQVVESQGCMGATFGDSQRDSHQFTVELELFTFTSTMLAQLRALIVLNEPPKAARSTTSITCINGAKGVAAVGHVERCMCGD